MSSPRSPIGYPRAPKDVERLGRRQGALPSECEDPFGELLDQGSQALLSVPSVSVQ
jgi:hypothetical protein